MRNLAQRIRGDLKKKLLAENMLQHNIIQRYTTKDKKAHY